MPVCVFRCVHSIRMCALFCRLHPQPHKPGSLASDGIIVLNTKKIQALFMPSYAQTNKVVHFYYELSHSEFGCRIVAFLSMNMKMMKYQ